MNDIIEISAVRTQNSAQVSGTLTVSTERSAPLIPLPELPITVRLATMDDLPFIDELQKKNNRNLGFLHRKALEGKINLGEVLIAESVSREPLIVNREEASDVSRLTTNDQRPTKLGYLIGNDRYFKRDELGAIFQLCVVPGKRRGLVGATLLKALFEHASYGCRLYCCWCAQDLEANHFWEAMGFVPVAFRSGAKKKLKGKDGKRTDRVHIFWQKRIRAGDTETPWWYPSQTGGGAIKEDRIVLPIPPGVHWSEVKSVVLPGDEATNDERLAIGDQSSPNATRLSLPKSAPTPNDEVETPGVEQKSKRTSKSKSNLTAQNSQPATGKKEPFTLRCSAIYFTPPVVEKPKAEKAKKEKAPKVKQKNDPKLVKAARELRDRYLEEVNQNPTLVSNGKYDVARLVEKTTVETVAPSVKLLDVLPVEVKRVEPMAA